MKPIRNPTDLVDPIPLDDQGRINSERQLQLMMYDFWRKQEARLLHDLKPQLGPFRVGVHQGKPVEVSLGELIQFAAGGTMPIVGGVYDTGNGTYRIISITLNGWVQVEWLDGPAFGRNPPAQLYFATQIAEGAHRLISTSPPVQLKIDYDWRTEDNLLASHLSTEIKRIAQDGVDEAALHVKDSIQVGGPNWTVINQRAAEWARTYTGSLAKGINDTTRARIGTELAAWITAGESFPALVQRMRHIIPQRGSTATNAFRIDRAELIASTEATKAYAEGNLLAWKSVPGVTGKEWRTANDERVCFPADTLISTERGTAIIRDILPGAQVWTRQGLRKVLAVSRRPYNGPSVTVGYDSDYVTATAEHPFWTLERGWTKAQDLAIGNTLHAVFNAYVHVRSLWYGTLDCEVYNLEVEGVPEYFANGILVHNCPVCGYLGGQQLAEKQVKPTEIEDLKPVSVALNADFVLPFGGGTIHAPPAHPRCLLPDTEVVSFGPLTAVTQAFYQGRCVEVILGNGRKLSVTENHPILTPAGFVAANRLRQGDDVICVLSPERIAQSIDPDNDYRPTSIEKVFYARLEAGSVSFVSVPAAAEQFHGDGRRMNGNVQIVGNANEAMYDALADAHFDQAIAEGVAVHFGRSREFVSQFAHSITVEQIVQVRDFDFTGHVYDLQSDAYELYSGNGVIVKNCRCWIVPVMGTVRVAAEPPVTIKPPIPAPVPAVVDTAAAMPSGMTDADVMALADAARQVIVQAYADEIERIGKLNSAARVAEDVFITARIAVEEARRRFIGDGPEDSTVISRFEKQNKAIVDEAEAKRKTLVAARNALAVALKEQGKKALEMLNVPDPIQPLNVKFDAYSTKNPVKEGEKLAANFDTWTKVVSAKIAPAENAPKITIDPVTTRAGYAKDGNKITLASGDSFYTLAHELGHWLEDNQALIKIKALEFLNRRRQKGEKPVRLIDVYPRSSYHKGEMAIKDKFDNAYMGKLYFVNGTTAGMKDVNATDDYVTPSIVEGTEVVSMGIEAYLRNPAAFAMLDPDYFNFIYALLRGFYHG